MSNTREIDGAWFTKKLSETNKSMRGLAKHLEVDVSAVSRMFAGTRKMKMNEASAIAAFLGAPVNEVLKHAGVSVDLDGQPTRIMLAAAINEKGQLERLDHPSPLPQAIIDRANAAISLKSGDGRILAAQVRALQGPLAFLDDAVILFGHTEGVERGAIGVLAICRLQKGGEQIIAKIDRARKTGEARVITVDGKSKEITLDTATPVIAIIP